MHDEASTICDYCERAGTSGREVDQLRDADLGGDGIFFSVHENRATLRCVESVSQCLFLTFISIHSINQLLIVAVVVPAAWGVD